MGRIGTRWKWAGLLALFLLPGILFGQEASVPADKQASILLKALSFDRNLKKRSGESIHIAVLYKGDGKVAEAGAIAAAFEQAGKDKIKGLPVKAQIVAFKSVGELLKQVEANNFNALYVHPSLATALSSVQQVARAKHIVSMGATGKMVAQGLSLGVGLKGGEPQLAVNLRAWKVEDVDLGQAILKISKVIQ